MPNISETLKNAAEILEKNKIDEPRRQAVSLLTFVLRKNQTFLIAHSEYELSAVEEMQFQSLLLRRAKREPLQYITGRQEFFGLDFKVTSDVLIPRPETELLVENAVEILKIIENPRFAEIGVGSGCISVSILRELENASALAADVSEKALAVAEENARTHKVAVRLKLQLSDVFANFEAEKFDLIVSNPPYISLAEMTNLQPEVGEFEPRTALTDGRDGLSIIEKIVSGAPDFLRSRGFLLLEIGFGQTEKTSRFFEPETWTDFEILPDLQGIPRVVRARIRR